MATPQDSILKLRESILKPIEKGEESILKMPEQTTAEVSSKPVSILKPKKEDIRVGRLFDVEDLYAWTEQGTRIKQSPEEFITRMQEKFDIDAEYAVDLYNFLSIKESKESKPFFAEMVRISPLWETSGFWSLDLLNLAGYTITAGTLNRLVPKKYKSVKSPEVTEDMVKAQAKKEGKVWDEMSPDDKLDFEYQRYYDPDPAANEAWSTLEKINRMDQLEGIDPKKIGIVEHTQFAKADPVMKFAKQDIREYIVRNGIEVDPAAQVAKETLDHEMIYKGNMSDMLYDIENSGFLTTWNKMSSVFRKATVSGLVAIRRSGGPAGKEFAEKLHNYINIPEMRASTVITEIRDAAKGLNKAEQENAIAVLDIGGYYREPVKVLNDKVKKYTDVVSKHTMAATDELRFYAPDSVASQSRPFFTHQLIDTNKLAKSKPELIQTLIKRKQVKNEAEAMSILEESWKKYTNRKFFGAENERTLHIKGKEELDRHGFNTNLVTSWENYFTGIYRRIEELKQFGENGNKAAWRLVPQISRESPVAGAIAARLFRRLTMRDEYDIVGNWAARKLINWTVITVMNAPSAIAQFGSVANIAMKGARVSNVTGAKAVLVGTYKGLKSIARGRDKEFVEQTGALFNNTINDLREMYGFSRFTEKWLKVIGLTPADNLTRAMAVHGGKIILNDLTKKLLKNPNNKRLLRMADEMDIDVKELIKTGGKLSEDKEKLVLKTFSDTTIGRARPGDIPLWWSHPIAKVITLFRPFAFFQTKFLKDNVWKEAIRHGNFRPLIPWVIAMQPLGELLADARAKITGRERPKGIDRMLDNIAMVQAFGIFQDMANSIVDGRILAFITGAVGGQLSNLGKLTKSLYEAIEKGSTPKELKRLQKAIDYFTIRAIPHFGRLFYAERHPETVKAPIERYR